MSQYLIRLHPVYMWTTVTRMKLISFHFISKSSLSSLDFQTRNDSNIQFTTWRNVTDWRWHEGCDIISVFRAPQAQFVLISTQILKTVFQYTHYYPLWPRDDISRMSSNNSDASLQRKLWGPWCSNFVTSNTLLNILLIMRSWAEKIFLLSWESNILTRWSSLKFNCSVDTKS